MRRERVPDTEPCGSVYTRTAWHARGKVWILEGDRVAVASPAESRPGWLSILSRLSLVLAEGDDVIARGFPGDHDLVERVAAGIVLEHDSSAGVVTGRRGDGFGE